MAAVWSKWKTLEPYRVLTGGFTEFLLSPVFLTNILVKNSQAIVRQ